MPMMAITTRSSMRVKALEFLLFNFRPSPEPRERERERVKEFRDVHIDLIISKKNERILWITSYGSDP